MAPARAAAYLGGATLLVAWLASAAAVSRVRSAPPVERRPSALVQLDAVAADVQSQAARLRTRLAAAPAPDSPRRNPFMFAMREPVVRAAVERRASERGSGRVPPSEPDLVMELVGIAEQKTDAGLKRTAMIGAPGDQLFMVSEGRKSSGRYRVSAVGADAVELKDLAHRIYAPPRPKVSRLHGFDRGGFPQLRYRACVCRFAPSVLIEIDHAHRAALARGRAQSCRY